MNTKVYAFTYAGKPLFTNCQEGDESLTFYGVLCAFVSKVSTLLSEYTDNDDLRYICAGEHSFVYLGRGPLCYFGIGSEGNSPLAVYKTLYSLHLQILSILTRGVERILLKRPSYDAQNLMGGTQSILHRLVEKMDGTQGLFESGCFEALPLPSKTRDKINTFFKDMKAPNVLCSFLLVSNRVAAVSMLKTVDFSATDIAIAVNMVTASNALQQQESWTPLCLPDFNDQAFTYAYVNYIEPEIGVVCVSSSGDQDQFHKISEHFTELKNQMISSGCIDDIRLSLSATPLEFPAGDLKQCEILHVLYLSKKKGQYFSSAHRQSAFGESSDSVLAAYKSLSELLFGNEAHRTATACFEVGIHHHGHLEECSQFLNIYVDHNPEFSLYMATAPWTRITTELVAGVVSYIAKQFPFLFITKVGTISVK